MMNYFIMEVLAIERKENFIFQTDVNSKSDVMNLINRSVPILTDFYAKGRKALLKRKS